MPNPNKGGLAAPKRLVAPERSVGASVGGLAAPKRSVAGLAAPKRKRRRVLVVVVVLVLDLITIPHSALDAAAVRLQGFAIVTRARPREREDLLLLVAVNVWPLGKRTDFAV